MSQQEKEKSMTGTMEALLQSEPSAMAIKSAF